MWLTFWLLFWLQTPPPVDLGALADCHRAARAINWKTGGDFEVRLQLADTGRVETVGVLKNTSGDAILERCVRYHLQNMLFAGRKSPLTLRFSFPRNLPQAGVWAADVPVSRAAGNGTAARILVHPGAVDGAGVSLSVVRIEKNGRMPLHLHQNTAVWYFVLEGSGRLEVRRSATGIAVQPLSPGFAGFIPAGLPHEFSGPAGGELVFLLIANPAGMERFFAEGEPARHDVLFFPPENASEPPPPAVYDRFGQWKRHDGSLSTDAPRNPEKKTWLSLPKIGELCIMAAPAGKSVRVAPPGGGYAAVFVLRGGGEWTLGSQTHVVQPGSGWFFREKAVYTPKVNNAPLYLIAYCNGGACVLQ